MYIFEDVKNWIMEDQFRSQCLDVASHLISGEWYIAAGFVRNLVWDRLHGYTESTALSDIDVIYFNASNTSLAAEVIIENSLKSMMSDCNWSVKNQARMSDKHGHDAYQNCIDAMSFWPEIQTAIGVTKQTDGETRVVSPFSPEQVIKLAVTRNSKCTTQVYYGRLKNKDWIKTWPELKLE